MTRKFTTKDGERTAKVRTQVVSLRDGTSKREGMSWAAIAAKLEVSPRTVRRIYDEAKGEGAHFESRLEGKGGRTRATEQAES